MVLYDRLSHQATAGPDPQETFTVSVVVRLVSASSGHPPRGLNAKSSANVDVETAGEQLQLCGKLLMVKVHLVGIPGVRIAEDSS